MSEIDSDTRRERARETLQGYPEGTLDAALDFLESRSGEALDRLFMGILQFHLPGQTPAGAPIAGLPGTTRFVEDLSVDSLAMVEMAFVLDDLLGVRLSPEEMRRLSTLDDLRLALRGRCGIT